MFRQMLRSGGSKVLVVGASKGIGKALTNRLLDHGVGCVFAAARRPLAATSTPSSGRVIPLTLDVTDEAAIAAAGQQLRSHTDRLDAIIYTAGLLHTTNGLQPERRLEEVTLANLQTSFGVNAFGPVLVAKEFSPLFPKKHPCLLAHVSARVGSIGDNGMGGWYAYRAAKAAQNMLTKTLSIELARKHKGVVCLALHPGTVDTGLSQPFQKNVPKGKLFDASQSASYLLDNVVFRVDHADNGTFWDWQGKPIPW
eukprot:m.81845 g.81845  ORF g.81845 m.81845 type:complete len:254 (-) comp14705_c0_seq1:57-818(-)